MSGNPVPSSQHRLEFAQIDSATRSVLQSLWPMIEPSLEVLP